MSPTLQKQIDAILRDAATKREWGEINIVLKDGKPVQIRRTVNSKVEESPADAHNNRS
jgi:hypothetical protein